MRKVIIAVGFAAASAAQAAVFTNVWKSANGGSWTDGANWEDPVTIGTNGVPIFADFSALEMVLATGSKQPATVTVPENVTIDLCGLKFRTTGTDSSRYDVQQTGWDIRGDWTYKITMPAGNKVTRIGVPKFRLHAFPETGKTPLEVWNGNVDLHVVWTFADAAQTVVEKVGNGGFSIMPSQGRLAKGTIELFMGTMYVRSGFDNYGNIQPGASEALLDTTIRVTDKNWKTAFDFPAGPAYVGALENVGWAGFSWRRNLNVGGLGVTNVVSELTDQNNSGGGGLVRVVDESCLSGTTIRGYGGDLITENGDFFAPTGKALYPTVRLNNVLNGSLFLGADQTARTLAGLSPFGATVLADGTTLSVGDANATDTEFRAALKGNGNLVKNGADYTLTMRAPSSYAGSTTVVEGTLVSSAAARPTRDLVAWYRFDDAMQPGRDSSGNGVDMDVSLLNASDVRIEKAEVKGGTRTVLALNTGVKTDERGYLKSPCAYPARCPRDNDDWSFSLWMKVNPTSYGTVDNKQSRPFSFGKSANFNGRDDSLFLQLYTDGTDTLTVPGPDYKGYKSFGVATRDWFHIVVTWHVDAEGLPTRKVYVDGEPYDSWTGKTTQKMKLYTGTGTPFQIGLCNSYYRGWIDELKIWNRAISAAEAKAEYDGTNDVAYCDLGSEHESLPTPVALADDLPSTNGAMTVSCWVEQGAVSGTSGGAAVSWGSSDGWIDVGYDENGFPGVRYNCFTNEFATERTETRFFVDNLRLAAGAASNPRHHLAYVYEQTSGRAFLYVDGVLRKSAALATYNAKVPPLRIVPGAFRTCSSVGDPAWTYSGAVSDVKVFNRALCSGEVLRLAMLDGGRSLVKSLPASTDVTVAKDATLAVDGAHETVGTLSGEGEVTVSSGSDLLTTKTSAFSGRLSGRGWFGSAGGDLTFDTTGATVFEGRVTAEGTGRVLDPVAAVLPLPAGYRGGVVIETGRGLGNLPNLLTADNLLIPEKGTVRFLGSAIAGRTVIAQGASVTAPVDFSGWKVEAGKPDSLCGWKFSVTEAGEFVVDVKGRGLCVIVK